MRSLKILAILVLGLSLTVWMACGGGGDDEEPVYQLVLSALSAKQGPNKNVLEPYEVVLRGTSGSFFTQTDPEAKAAELLESILLISNPGGAGEGKPDQVIIAALLMGLDMGEVAATAAAGDECNTWENTTLPTNTGGCAGPANVTNCFITSQQSGAVSLNFGAAPGACNYGGLLTSNETQYGALSIAGELRTPLYPAYRPGLLTPDCDNPAVDCRDVWVTGLSSNWGSAGDALTGVSAMSGYIFNYDLNGSVSIRDLPLFIVANLQLNGSNVAGVFGMPTGVSGFMTDYFGGIVDAQGAVWGYKYSDDGPGGAGARIMIVSLPIQSDGSLCLSVFDSASGASEDPTDYVFNAAESDSCGLQ